MNNKGMDTQNKLLIVDDEIKLRNLLKSYLAGEGFDVVAVASGAEMDQHLENHQADLIILDLMLPGENGLSIARRLRRQSQVPIIILSALGDEADRITGLEIGVDDYLAKPFNPRELLARIRAVLRRNAQGVEASSAQSHLFNFGPFCLDSNKHELTKDDQAINLTSGEFNMLRILVDNIDQVISRDELLAISKGYERTPFDRSVDICIGRLRKKIEPDPANPTYLKTVWGAGYLLSSQDS